MNKVEILQYLVQQPKNEKFFEKYMDSIISNICPDTLMDILLECNEPEEPKRCERCWMAAVKKCSEQTADGLFAVKEDGCLAKLRQKKVGEKQ